MIMQMLRRWLNNLLVRWPWTRSTRVNYEQVVTNVGWGITSESVWYANANGVEPSITGNTSMVLEQHIDEPHPDTRATSQDAAQAKSPSSRNTSKHISLSAASMPNNLPHAENHLQFLRYLVQHGILNEGFSVGQEPEQYRKR